IPCHDSAYMSHCHNKGFVASEKSQATHFLKKDTDDSLFESPPVSEDTSDVVTGSRRNFRGTKLDYGKREAENSRLGKQGELFVLDAERRRLAKAGHQDLSNRVEWVADTKGDGLGYDILSFTLEGEETFIEVKTTKYGKFFPFYVTENEVLFSEFRPAQFLLYRLFDFPERPRIFVLQGSLRVTCRLKPTDYQATAL
ncbi:DUF3883 domain-containing protein, partial [Bdellovibrionota bacterium FG-1]